MFCLFPFSIFLSPLIISLPFLLSLQHSLCLEPGKGSRKAGICCRVVGKGAFLIFPQLPSHPSFPKQNTEVWR